MRVLAVMLAEDELELQRRRAFECYVGDALHLILGQLGAGVEAYTPLTAPLYARGSAKREKTASEIKTDLAKRLRRAA